MGTKIIKELITISLLIKSKLEKKLFAQEDIKKQFLETE